MSWSASRSSPPPASCSSRSSPTGPTDPSFNTVGSAVAHNWAGIFGATLSDLLFQFEGFAAFCLPLMLGLLGH